MDAVYMTATQAMTGQGGWPMTVFVTPEGEPFYSGTYFPRERFQRLRARRSRRPGAMTASGVSRQAAGRRRAGRARPRRARTGRRRRRRERRSPARRATQAVDRAGRGLRRQRGGFGGAPKFPPSMVLEFLLRHGAAGRPSGPARMADGTADADGARRHVRPARRGLRPLQRRRRLGRAALREDAVRQRAARPGVRAPVAGTGIAAGPAGGAWRPATGCSRELRTPEGGFAVRARRRQRGRGRHVLRLDAGRAARRRSAPSDGAFAAAAFEVTGAGTFEHGRSVLQLRADPADAGSLRRSARRCSRAGPHGSARAGTTRWSRPGTAWPSRRWPSAGCCSSAPDLVEAARDGPRLLADVHLAAPGWRAPRATGGPGPAPGCWRTTPAWPRASCPVRGDRARPAG